LNQLRFGSGLKSLNQEYQPMWATSQGDRTLGGHEAKLVRSSVGYLRDMITAGTDIDEPYQTDVAVFNRLQSTQQLAVLHEVGYALLDPATPVLELTSIREGTVHVIYRELAALVEIEIDLTRIDDDPDYSTRSSIVAACDYFNRFPAEWTSDFIEEPAQHRPPKVDCDDVDQWSAALEFLADQVLWDRDFEMEAIFADHDPERINAIKEFMGIKQDYYAVPAPDVFSEEYYRIDRELVLLTADGHCIEESDRELRRRSDDSEIEF
jgi:hypothetical protein